MTNGSCFFINVSVIHFHSAFFEGFYNSGMGKYILKHTQMTNTIDTKMLHNLFNMRESCSHIFKGGLDIHRSGSGSERCAMLKIMGIPK